ncbi:MAG: TetR/AcrR family transcriptional regulator [Labilithrix sp.]|nr:TetR/AcrR family transcriptional regulator [Labilithrix sp.]
MALAKRSFKQQRSEQTYEAILEAAARVFPKLGFEGTQTPDIAREAGISTGAVYRYFDDKRHVFLEMLEVELAKVRAEVDRRLEVVVASAATGDPAKAVGLLIDTLFEQVKKDAALSRVFAALSLTDPDVAAIRARAEAHDRGIVAAMIEAAIPREVIPDPHAAALVIYNAAIGSATELALRPKRAKGPSEVEVKAALERMLVRYVFARPA